MLKEVEREEEDTAEIEIQMTGRLERLVALRKNDWTENADVKS